MCVCFYINFLLSISPYKTKQYHSCVIDDKL